VFSSYDSLLTGVVSLDFPPDENVTHTEEAENNRDENVTHTHTQKRLRITKIKNSKLVKLISLRPEL
jgi:hypothetical protein